MISFFALGSYIGKSYSKHGPDSARRLSSRIRAEEMSEYLGAKLNPTEGYENGVCIYVKPRSLDNIKDGSYVDFLDGEFRDTWLIKRPKIKVIAASLHSYEYMKARLPNEIVLIPSHHINIERTRRDRKKVTMAGYIGVPSPESFKRFDDIAKRLGEIGLDFTINYYHKTRQDALDFYKRIDIFVSGDWDGVDHPYRIPTKIINASSFGIPVVAAPMKANKELDGYYLPARNMEEMVDQVKKLKDEVFYDEMVSKIVPMSENYHIDKIAELYRKL